MPRCEKCFQKTESVRESGELRGKAPQLSHIGSSGKGEVWCCPECGSITVRPKGDKHKDTLESGV